jgi:hypothetical protein
MGPEQFQVRRYIAYFHKVKSEFERAWKSMTDTYPDQPFNLVRQPRNQALGYKRSRQPES